MKTDLSGLWQVCLDTSGQSAPPRRFPDVMRLPGTTSCAGLGPDNTDCPEGHLTDAHGFEGSAWFCRELTVEETLPLAMLTLERTRVTTVWLDGVCLGTENSLCTPHRYVFPGPKAGTHTLVIRVDNTSYPTGGGHMTSPDTQTNWNGITGEISLTLGKTLLRDVMAEPGDDLCSLHVRCEVLGWHEGVAAIVVEGYGSMEAPVTDGHVDAVLRLERQPPLWDEFHPNLLTLRLCAGDAVRELAVGMRRMSAQGRTLLVNGREAFLRGTHDALVFPLTGYAPTEEEPWLRVLGAYREYGLNHVRFHTCCPPGAAFAAADRLGMYMEPELPFWGTIAAPGEEGFREEEQRYLLEEGKAMLRQFGHHPSFVMMSLGNELWGSGERLNGMLCALKAVTRDKLYTAGSNNFQFAPRVLPEEDFFCGVRLGTNRLFRGSYAMCDVPLGHVQTTEPESVYHYDEVIAPSRAEEGTEGGRRLIQYGTGVREVSAQSGGPLVPHVPVVSHEIGQYTFYPDFDEIDRYTGALRARNMECFAARLKERGLYDRRRAYFRSAGHLAVDCYRREIETALRTRELAGFQLLDIKDYPGQGTALVGVMNALMEDKGLIAREAWRAFCGPTVVLARLRRFVLSSGDELRFGVSVSEENPDRHHTRVAVELREGECLLACTEAAVPLPTGRLTDCGEVSLGCITAQDPRSLTLRLTLEDGTCNSYDLWVFPRGQAEITPAGIDVDGAHVAFVASAAEAAALGGQALVVPPDRDGRPAEYCTDFWCYPMFRAISESMGKPLPVGTMGLCIDPEHPALSGFPAKEYTTPPWYRLLRHAHCQVLDARCDAPVEMIDNTARCERLGLIYEKDGAWHCTIRLWEAANEPEARCLAESLARHVLRKGEEHA